MIDGEGIEKIVGLTMKSLETKEIGGLPYLPVKPHLVAPPEVAPLNMMSLSSLVLFADKADLKPESNVFHIESPTRVRIVSIGYNTFMQRQCLGVADVTEQVSNNFDYGCEHNLEDFIIALKSGFQETENLNKIIEMVSQIRISDDDEIEDDGITQRVSAKAGIVLRSKIELPNPVELVPFRSFPEVELPPEKFVFRVSKRGDRYSDNKASFRLFKSKSMAWQLDCVEKIKTFLTDAGSLPVI